MGKRKEDQRRDDSSSSSGSFDAKRHRPRHYKNGETSRPNDRTLTRIELKDAIQQDKESTEAKFNREIEMLKKKSKKDKKDIRILKEDIRILKQGHEDLKSKFKKMQKGGCADHYKASPSERSQLSQSTRFRLVIENSVSKTIYKNQTIETEDGGGHIKVIMYDGGNRIAPDHPLASVKVDLVVIKGRFNDKRDSWSKEEFEKSIITPREGIIRLVKNGTFHLIGGSCDHQGAIIMDNSQKKEVKLGVRIAVPKEERVLEGVSNPFRVQEVKTKRSQKNGKQPFFEFQHESWGSQAAPTRHCMGQGSVRQVCQHSLPQPLQNLGQGPVSPVSQHSSPPPVIQDVLQTLVNQHLPAQGQDQDTSFPNGSSELGLQNPSAEVWLIDNEGSAASNDFFGGRSTPGSQSPVTPVWTGGAGGSTSSRTPGSTPGSQSPVTLVWTGDVGGSTWSRPPIP